MRHIEKLSESKKKAIFRLLEAYSALNLVEAIIFAVDDEGVLDGIEQCLDAPNGCGAFHMFRDIIIPGQDVLGGEKNVHKIFKDRITLNKWKLIMDEDPNTVENLTRHIK